jgi:hypothetical protein
MIVFSINRCGLREFVTTVAPNPRLSSRPVPPSSRNTEVYEFSGQDGATADTWGQSRSNHALTAVVYVMRFRRLFLLESMDLNTIWPSAWLLLR